MNNILKKINIFKKSNKTTMYYEFVSLGYNCLSRRILTEMGLMKTKEQGQLTLPFDLCVTFPDMITIILKTNFKDYLKYIEYDESKNGFYNKKYKIYYNHDADCPNNIIGKNKIINRYKKRIKNYKKIISKNNSFIFVLNNYYQSEEVVNELYKTLCNNLINKNFCFLLLDLECKINAQLLDSNIILCQKMHPFDNLDNWWRPENLHLLNEMRDELKPIIIDLLKEKIDINKINTF